MRLIPFILLGLAAFASARASDFSWVIQGDESLELRHKQSETIARFRIDPQPADPHFDILKTVGGENLLWVGPDDHPWHYGLWFSWKYIKGVNFWETDRKTGQSAGLTEVTEPEIRIKADTAQITYTRFYRLKAEAEPVLRDEFTIDIQAPGGEGKAAGPIIDWSITTTALTGVTLDRTPVPGEPGGKSWGGYAGLSWRGAKELKQVQFSDSEGRTDMEIHRQRARWVNAVGQLGDQPAGIAIIYESEPDSSWYLFCTEKLPFWFINPAILQSKPLTLNSGTSFSHRYRVIVHNGSWVFDHSK